VTTVTKEDVIKAIDAYNSDTSRTKQETLDGLEEIVDNISGRIESLYEEMDDEAGDGDSDEDLDEDQNDPDSDED